jgi:hypothetical protein
MQQLIVRLGFWSGLFADGFIAVSKQRVLPVMQNRNAIKMLIKEKKEKRKKVPLLPAAHAQAAV